MTEKLTEPLRYESSDDVKMRLDSTYLRYKSTVYWCRWYDGLAVKLSDNDGRNALVVHSSNEQLDVSSIPLGFLPFPPGNTPPVVARRHPVRKYKQGIAVNNVYYEVFSESSRRGAERSSQEYFSHPSFLALLRNKFPTFSVAYKTGLKLTALATDATFGIAFSRNFCLLHSRKVPGKLSVIDQNFEEVGTLNDAGILVINEWWATPTMVETLNMLGVPTNITP